MLSSPTAAPFCLKSSKSFKRSWRNLLTCPVLPRQANLACAGVVSVCATAWCVLHCLARRSSIMMIMETSWLQKEKPFLCMAEMPMRFLGPVPSQYRTPPKFVKSFCTRGRPAIPQPHLSPSLSLSLSLSHFLYLCTLPLLHLLSFRSPWIFR